MAKLKDTLSTQGLSELGDHLESLGFTNISEVFKMIETDTDVWEKLKLNNVEQDKSRIRLEHYYDKTNKTKNNSKIIKFSLLGLTIIVTLWGLGIFDFESSSEKEIKKITEKMDDAIKGFFSN